ncbi:LPD1 domain-containing protein [Limnobacter sp. P1]|uniref:ADP-ribosyltransferase-containing protein n=1 Tax=Limnobacter olei TaxID=3031298 RepID=UPI0023B0EC47|nr:LPD1 domain-containing protein [Limnobacter sp. P1]
MEKNFFDQFDSTDSNSSGSSSDNFFDQFDAPTPKKKKDEDRGVLDVVKDLGVSLYEGAKGTGRMLGAAGNTVTGDLADVEGYAASQNKAAADKPQALQNLNADLESRRQKLGEDAGVLDSIGAVGGALANNPEGAAQFVIEQAPNSAVSLGSGLAGAKAGAVAGGTLGALLGPAGSAVGATVGGVGGFLGGMFLGNAALETGGKAIEKAEGGFTEAERGEAIKEGAVKGGVITAVDAATLGAGGLVAKGFAKEAIEAGARAEAKVLSRAGVDVASREAVESALSDAALRTAAEEAGKKAAQAATTLKNRLAAGGTGLTMETAGEGVGEYLGELAATGEADVYDAVIESFAGLSQSAVETAYNLKNAQGNDLDSRGIARAGQNLEPDQEGEGGTAIAEGSTANAVTFKPDPATPDTSGSENVASATDDEAVRALKTPVQLTALDRAQELDSEIGRLTERLTELSPENGYGEAFDAERNEIATRAQELAMERDEIAKTWPKAVPGIETEFSTESGAKIQGQYAIMDAADLVTSNDENLKANPLYPKELQPRDRSRQASEIQISGIVGKLDPARLGVSADAATGAPIVGADGLVESGNARTIALKRVYQANGQKAEDYKSFLRANAQQFGLTPEQIDQVQKPVLVRVRSTPVNRAEFARQANASTVQRMSPSEAALSDASRLTSLEGLNPDENGDFDSSIDFIRQFMATLPITEQSDMLESDGRLSTTGYRRIQNAVLAKAYGDSPTLRRMTESRDDNLRNITKALTFAAPTIAAARERIASGSMYDADIASDLIQAVEGLSSIKQRGWTVDQELAQTDLTGPKYSEESAELLNFLDQNIRSPRRIAEFMQRYYEALEAAGDPNQGTMFDEPVAPTRQGLINQARGQNVPTTANTERGIDPEAAQAAQESGGQPEDAPRNQGRNQGDEGPGSGTGARSEESSREDANWVNYPKKSGTLGIPRAEMPQIKSEARGALVQFLKARGIDSESKSVPASELKPTQAEYSADKVKRFIESGPVDGSRSVLISSDNHVLDGHHQWMTFQAMGKEVPVIQLNAPIRELLEQVYEFPSAKRSEGAPTESGTETTAAANSQFPTISETKAPSMGPMGSVKITPIAQGKPLFRQTNLEGLDDVARYDNQAENINLFVTDNVDLALGQAGNKGVLIEFRPDSLSGTENVKPGTGDATGREYKANVMAKRPIAAVTMNAVDFPRLRGVTRNLLRREFTKSVLGDGIVQYKRNGLEVTGETGSIASKGISKTVPKTTGLPIAAAKKRNTEDAGEELVANKRNRPDQALTWNDLKNKEATLRVNETTKANVYPKPNYEELVQGGMEPLVAHMVKQAYDSLSPKPQVRSAPTDQDLQLYIEAVNIYMKGVTQWATDEKAVADWLKSANGRSSVRGSENAPKIPLEYVYPTGWRNNRDRLMVIGGNKALSALQPGYTEIKKATRDLEKGWPKKVEAWVKQGYQIADGSKAEADFFENSTGVTASIKVPRARGLASIAAKSFPGLKQGDKEVSDWVSSTIAQFKDSFIVLDKQGRNKGAAKSIESAEELARQLVKRKSSSTEVSDKGISVLQAQREGPEYRMEGEDVTSERFLETFGFRGVNFGNWMKGKSNEKERQLHLNHAYDSFMDLAALLNLPPQAMSLNGLLGIAFGAQGRSGAAAHFVPGVNEINLTRESGAGSLGHEWGHALDHYFARLAGLERDTEPFITEHANSNPMRRVSELVDGKYKVVEKPRFDEQLRPEILDKFKAVVDSINKRELTPAEMLVRRNDALARSKKNVDGWLNAIRKDLERAAKTDAEKYLLEFDGLAAKIRALELGDGAVQAGNSAISPAVDSIRSLFKSATGRLYSLDQIRGLQSNVDSLRYLSEAKNDDKSHIPQFVPTDFSKNAQELDGQKGGKAYWNTTVEKFARAFDAYLTDRLAERAQVNSYLSHTGRDGPTVPQGQERKAINTAFDALVGEFKTREEDGGVVLFNRETASPESDDLNETPDDIVRRVLGVDTATARAAMDRVSFPWQNRSNNIKSLADRRDALEIEALSVLAAWKNPPKLVVVESLQDARTPLAIRRLDEKQRAQGASGSIPGFFFDNTVYLVTDSVKDRASMVRTLAHESFVHYGFRNVYGSALDGILTQLYQARPDLVKKKAKQYGMDISDKRQRLEAAEEVLAEMAETDPNLGFVRRAIAAIRTWLRANFPFMNQLSLTDDEIIQNFIAPARNWVKNGARQATLAPVFDAQNPAFSRSTDATASEEFKKWFGDWKQAASARMPRAASGLEQAKETAKTFVGKPIVNRSTDLVGMVSNNNLSKMASQKAGDKSASMLDHALAIANLDKLFENAVLDHSHADNKGEPTIKAIRRYIAPMFGVNGDLRAVKLTVKETTGPKEPNPIYTVEAMEIENPPSVLSRANPNKTGIRPQAGLSSSVKSMLDQVNDVSKVVDKEGEPLVVYHGTGADISKFKPSARGSFGSGVYFSDRETAENYASSGDAATIVPVYLSMKNPLVVDADYGRGEEIDFDSAAIPLVEALFGGEAGPVIEKSKNGDGFFGKEIQQEAKRQGFDGLILTYPDGSKEYVVFDPTQIKSAIGNQGTFDPDNADIRLSNSGVGGGVDVAALEKLAASVKKRLPNLPEVVVLGEPYQAPRALREYIVQQGAVLDAEGAYHNGKLYMFASGLADLARAEFVLAEHEAAHFGLRAVLGDRLKAVMNQIYNNNSSVRKAATELQRNGKLTNAQATEEVLVDMPSSELIRLKGWRKLTALIRDWLDSAGFSNLAKKLQKWLAAGMDTQQQADLYAADIVRAARDFVAGKSLGRAETSLVRTEAMLSRGDGEVALSRAAAPKTVAERASDIISSKAEAVAPLEKVLKTATKLTGIERLTNKIYDEAANLLQRLPETVKAGVVSDYGVPEAVIDQRVLLQGRQRVQLRKAGNLVEKLATLTREESRVAYEWLNAGDSPRAQQLMDALPADSVKVLKDVQQMIDRLSREAMALGQLDAETFERNKFAYLRRSYAKHIMEQTKGEKARRSRVLSILGDQYKGRGLTDSVPMAKIQNLAPEWWGRKMAKGKADTALKGQKFVRMERRKAAGQGTAPLPGMQDKADGKLLEVVFYPAGEQLPNKYADWKQAGIWEVRTVKGNDAVMWRDFTKAERESMGEVDEARFAIAKTLHGMIHDVEVGRYLEWLGIKYAKKPGEEMEGDIVEASERYRDTFKPTDWVQVPETKVSGTNVLKYGKLAGRYIPGPIWNDLRQVVNGQFRLGDTYAKILSLWKTSKTALSPAVHMNNIMSNFVMADWHGVTAGHVAKALRLVLAASKGENEGLLAGTGKAISRAVGISDREAAREVLNRYSDSGGDVGSWVTNEIATDQLEPLLKSLEVELAVTAGASHQAQTGVFAALQHALMLRFPSAWEAFKPSKTARAIGNEAKALISLYQTEDNIFRLAAWLRAKEQGMDDLSAGKASRKSFLDYNINAPWIQAMRNSVFPFISFTYRAVPMMLEVAGKRPHKLLKLMMVAGALNALGAMLAGDDDEEERKLLPEEKAGKIWGMVPKLIRMPWNDKFGSPVYLDIRRFIPVGDVLDLGATTAAFPILPVMQVSGPLALIIELLTNKSMFTGKPITQETDTAVQIAVKVVDHLYKSFAPNILGLPGTYATEGVVGSFTGRTDAFGREMSTAQAVASSFGIKLGSYPADVLRRNLRAKTQFQMMEIQRNISQLKRQRQTGRLDKDEFADKVRVELEKKAKVQKELAEKLK